jgi:hypothetical protein
MEFESSSKGDKPVSQICVVYDPQDGRIVMVHEFIGDGTGVYGPHGQEERARVTLDDAGKNHAAPEQLQVLHLEPNFRPAHNTVYRVDVNSGKLVPRRQLQDPVVSRATGIGLKGQPKQS